MAELKYMSGFGNEFESEAIDFQGALPRDQINPQRCPYNLIAEQLSGSAFTAPRCSNRRSWLYRKRPSVCHSPYKPDQVKSCPLLTTKEGQVDINQRRWHPFGGSLAQAAAAEQNFITGMKTVAFSNPDCGDGSSIAIHIYLAARNMERESFVNSDGDFLVVPQCGKLIVQTEFGIMRVSPGEIFVVQQGMKFSVSLDLKNLESGSRFARGYVLEVRGNHFELPQLGPIGANCLANPRDFLVPTAYFEPEASKPSVDTNQTTFLLRQKFQNELFVCEQNHTPYDVAAWFGNYVPYKYDLSKFVSVNSVSVDHPDPSIFTVLTCPSNGKPGTALADFVIFPPRWECADNTFRPPYFHRNCMTEFMGLIKGHYQAKSGKFAPGGASLHHCMTAHGPDLESYQAAVSQDTSQPKRIAQNDLAFMFETSLSLRVSRWAIQNDVDENYHQCWQGLSQLMT